MKRFNSLIFTTLATMLMSSVVLAKEINLYDEPKDGAKVVGQIDIAAGIVPIFTSKNGDWMKVGDPRNGNVGWIKSADTSTPGEPSAISFTQKVIRDDKGNPHTYQTMQYGKPAQLQNDEMIRKMQKQQELIWQSSQKALEDVMVQMKNLYQWNKQNGAGNFPMIMPVVVMPPAQPTHDKPATVKK